MQPAAEVHVSTTVEAISTARLLPVINMASGGQSSPPEVAMGSHAAQAVELCSKQAEQCINVQVVSFMKHKSNK